MFLDPQAEAVCIPDWAPMPGPRDGRTQTPEGELLFAIIMQAAQDYAELLRARRDDTGARRQLEELEIWFTAADTGVPSFRGICDLLHLDPDYMWRQIRQRVRRGRRMVTPEAA
jgi:hypothetical protein